MQNVSQSNWGWSPELGDRLEVIKSSKFNSTFERNPKRYPLNCYFYRFYYGYEVGGLCPKLLEEIFQVFEEIYRLVLIFLKNESIAASNFCRL